MRMPRNAWDGPHTSRQSQHDRKDGQSSGCFPKQVPEQSSPHIASNANLPRLNAYGQIQVLQSLDSQVYIEPSRLAKGKGVSVQELIRALIIPDWICRQDNQKAKKSR